MDCTSCKRDRDFTASDLQLLHADCMHVRENTVVDFHQGQDRRLRAALCQRASRLFFNRVRLVNTLCCHSNAGRFPGLRDDSMLGSTSYITERNPTHQATQVGRTMKLKHGAALGNPAFHAQVRRLRTGIGEEISALTKSNSDEISPSLYANVIK